MMQDVGGPSQRFKRWLERTAYVPVHTKQGYSLVSTYRTVTPPNAAQQAKDAFAKGIDIVTFTSLSTVRNLLSLLEHKEALSASPVACIGPVTSGTARKLGPQADIESEEHTVDCLADALTKYPSDKELTRIVS